jgi:hypothetical protein
VKVGVRQGEDVQISEGLNAGEKVVTAGAFGLPDKTKVKVEVAPPAGDEKPAAGNNEKAAPADKNGGDKKDDK